MGMNIENPRNGRNMKPGAKLTPGALALLILIVALASGCGGDQTGQANQIVAEANNLYASVEPTMIDAQGNFDQGIDALDFGLVDDGKRALTKGLEQLNQAMPQLKDVKSKLEQAAALDISDSYRRYLQAKIRAREADIALKETAKKKVAVLLADPTLVNPATLTQMQELNAEEDKQVRLLEEANNEAEQIAAENQGEIETAK